MGVANEDVTVGQLMEFVCTNLPVGWEIEFWMREGSAGVQITRDRKLMIEILQGNLVITEMVIFAVNHARRKSGLEPVPFPSQRESYP